MKTAIRVLLWMSLLLITSSTHAQTESGNDDPSVPSNLGMPLSVPLNPTARFVSGGWGVDYGAGYNFTRRHAVIGEFMWNSLYASNEALQQVRAALQSSKVSGHGNLFAFTGNYRYELRGRTFGTYFIGGGGWYYRNASLSKPVPTGTTATCTPPRAWWRFIYTIHAINRTATIANAS